MDPMHAVLNFSRLQDLIDQQALTAALDPETRAALAADPRDVPRMHLPVAANADSISIWPWWRWTIPNTIGSGEC